MKREIYFLSIITFFISCNVKTNNTVSGIVFDINGLNSSIKSIENQGFKIIPDDVIVYSKKNRDTTIYVNIHRKFKDIDAINWEFNLKDSRKSYVLNYFKNKGFTLLSPITNLSNGYSFEAIRKERENIVFYFEITNYNNTPSLVITYLKPR